MSGKDYGLFLVKPEMLSASIYRRTLGLLVCLVITGVLALGLIGWVANGSVLFLAMAESLAAWCM